MELCEQGIWLCILPAAFLLLWRVAQVTKGGVRVGRKHLHACGSGAFSCLHALQLLNAWPVTTPAYLAERCLRLPVSFPIVRPPVECDDVISFFTQCKARQSGMHGKGKGQQMRRRGLTW